MSKCDCWHEVEPFCYNDKINGVCYGTKEREYCQCGGDNAKCDFYPEKRKGNKTMKTLEMMNAAKANGKTYWNEANDILYCFGIGFVESSNVEPVAMNGFDGSFNDFMAFSWQEVNTMTRSEAEEKYGIKIIG